MHDELSVNSKPISNKFLLGRRRMDQQHIRLSLLAHGHGLAGTHGDRFDEIARLLLKDRDQDIEKSGVLRTRCRRENDRLLLSLNGVSLMK